MTKKSHPDLASRRRKSVNLLQEDGGLSLSELEQRMPGNLGVRTIQDLIQYLRTHFPKQVHREATGGNRGDSRATFRWSGPAPHFLDQPLAWLSEDELVALIAARGLLHQNDRAFSATRGTARTYSGLSGAAHRLIERAGLADPASDLGRHTVSVSRFGAAPIDPEVLQAAFLATVGGRGLAFTYTNNDGVTGAHHVAPQRLVLIRSEWYLVAWEGVLRMFRVARITDASRQNLPPGMTAHVTSEQVDTLLEHSFFATGSFDPKKLQQVVLAIAPGAWPFIQGRQWGTFQRIDQAPADLPAGWRRLTFKTTGLAECRHWVLSMGTGVRAEEPQELVAWVRNEAQAVADSYGSTP